MNFLFIDRLHDGSPSYIKKAHLSMDLSNCFSFGAERGSSQTAKKGCQPVRSDEDVSGLVTFGDTKAHRMRAAMPEHTHDVGVEFGQGDKRTLIFPVIDFAHDCLNVLSKHDPD